MNKIKRNLNKDEFLWQTLIGLASNFKNEEWKKVVYFESGWENLDSSWWFFVLSQMMFARGPICKWHAWPSDKSRGHMLTFPLDSKIFFFPSPSIEFLFVFCALTGIFGHKKLLGECWISRLFWLKSQAFLRGGKLASSAMKSFNKIKNFKFINARKAKNYNPLNWYFYFVAFILELPSKWYIFPF